MRMPAHGRNNPRPKQMHATKQQNKNPAGKIHGRISAIIHIENQVPQQSKKRQKIEKQKHRKPTNPTAITHELKIIQLIDTTHMTTAELI